MRIGAEGTSVVNPRTRTRQLAGGGVVACGLVLLSFVVSLDGTSAMHPSIPDQDPPPGDEAPTRSTIRMKERCIWYVDGVPALINLQPTGDDVAGYDDDGNPIGKVYDGSEYSLSVTLPELRAWNSGNESGGGEEFVDEHAFCTYFGVTSGIEVTGEWGIGGFTANAAGSRPDEELDFDLTPANPLVMTLDEGTCRTPSQGVGESAWEFGGDSFLANDGSYRLTKVEVDTPRGGRLLQQPIGATTDRPANVPGGNDRCGINWSVQVSIPAGRTPRFAGEAYTFLGPTFTTEIAIDSGGS